jgi:hypothetical protein
MSHFPSNNLRFPMQSISATLKCSICCKCRALPSLSTSRGLECADPDRPAGLCFPWVLCRWLLLLFCLAPMVTPVHAAETP